MTHEGGSVQWSSFVLLTMNACPYDWLVPKFHILDHLDAIAALENTAMLGSVFIIYVVFAVLSRAH